MNTLGPRTRGLTVTAGLIVGLVQTTSASAAWSAIGTGSSKARASAITAPGAPIVPSTSTGSVAVSWSGATGPAGQTLRYFVERMVGATPTAVCASSFAAPITGASCTDANVGNGTYKYRVTTRLGANWQAVSAESGSVTVNASSLTITTPADGNNSFGRNPSVNTAGTGSLGAGYGTTVSAVLKQGTTTIQSASPAVNSTTGAWSYATTCLAKSTSYVLTVTQTTPTGSQSAASSFSTLSANPNC